MNFLKFNYFLTLILEVAKIIIIGLAVFLFFMIYCLFFLFLPDIFVLYFRFRVFDYFFLIHIGFLRSSILVLDELALIQINFIILEKFNCMLFYFFLFLLYNLNIVIVITLILHFIVLKVKNF